MNIMQFYLTLQNFWGYGGTPMQSLRVVYVDSECY